MNFHSKYDEMHGSMPSDRTLLRRGKWRRGIFIASAGLLGVLICVILVLLCLPGKHGNEGSAPPPPPAAGLPLSLGEAHTLFGLRLLRLLVTSDANNVFFSPVSIAVALAMCSRGTNSVARDELYQALYLSGLGDESAVTQAYEEHLSYLQKAYSDATLVMANSMWTTVDIYENYVEAVQTTFQADVFALTDADPINAWVKEKTNGTISNIIQDVDPAVVLILVNAVYFKAPWANPFYTSQTSQQAFYSPAGVKQVAMMYRSAMFPYRQTEEFQLVQLPYVRGSDFAALILLPAKGVDYATFVQTITTDMLTNVTKTQGELRLPRMKIGGKAMDLIPTLRQTGVQAIFRSGSLTRMTAKQTVVGEVIHKAILNLDEEGTEAAAATSMAVELTSIELSPVKPFEMIVDRPFVFIIQNTHTHEILFIGLIVDPQPAA